MVSLTLLPGKNLEQILSEAASEHVKVKKVNRTSQHGLNKGKPYLTNLIVLNDNIAGSAMRGENWMSSYLDFSKAFNIFSYSILIYTSRAFIV